MSSSSTAGVSVSSAHSRQFLTDGPSVRIHSSLRATAIVPSPFIVSELACLLLPSCQYLRCKCGRFDTTKMPVGTRIHSAGLPGVIFIIRAVPYPDGKGFVVFQANVWRGTSICLTFSMSVDARPFTCVIDETPPLSSVHLP